MTDTYMVKPWISLDQIDENGVRAEILVYSGVGTVDELRESKSGKAYNVHFATDNNEHGQGGNVAKDDPVAKAIEEAEKNGTPIGFRVEKRRKDNVDRKAPMSEISPPYDMKAAKDNTFKSLVAVLPEGETEWIRSSSMKTRFEEDPKTTSHGGAYDVDLETFTGKKQASNGATAEPPVYRTKSKEAPPFADYNNDGSINLGSVALGVPLNIRFFINEYCRDNNVDLTDDERASVSSMVLKIANTLQKKIYKEYSGVNLKKPMLSAGSHSRARQIVFELIKSAYPITKDLNNDEAFRAWGRDIINEGLGLWLWSIGEGESFLN